MVDRIKAAVDGRTDGQFVIMARTDAHAVEGHQAAIDRAQRYVEAGADMIFAEALTTLDEYSQFTSAVKVRCSEHHRVRQDAAVHGRRTRERGVQLVLYPLSAFRAMSRAAEVVYGAIRSEGTQKVSWIGCRRAPSFMTCSATTTTSASSDELFRREAKEP